MSAAAATASSSAPAAAPAAATTSTSAATTKAEKAAAAAAEKAAAPTVYNIKKQTPDPAFVLHPKGVWRSYGSEKDIAAEAPPKMERAAPQNMLFTMRRDFFLKRRTLHNFLNRDAADDGATYLRPTKDSMEKDPWVLRMESEASVQAVKTKAEHATQVATHRKVDFSVQVQPEIVDACAPPPIKAAFTDAGAEEAEEELGRERGKKLGGFFDKVMPRMLHHLTQSAAIPLFQDDFSLLMDEDNTAVVSNREESDLIEAGNFSHPYTRDRYISAVDWKPGPKMTVAVASIKASALEHRLEAALDVEPSVSVIWSLHEQTNPQMLLESPTEVLCIKFHPKPLSQIVVAGLTNGQIAMWDMSRAPVDPKAGRGGGVGGGVGGGGVGGGIGGGVGGGGGGGGTGAAAAAAASAAMGRAHLTMEEEVQVHIPPLPQPIRGHTTEEAATDEHLVSRLQPSMVSRVENSHRRAVHDICWLPDGLECGFDGRATVTDQCYQFATISEDGFVFIWDLRPENLPSDRLRKLKHQGRSTGDEHAKVWVPMLRYQLPRAELPGDLLGLRLHVEGRTQNGQGPPSYLFMATTIEGELCCGNWGPKPGTEDAPKSVTGYDAGAPAASGSAKIVRYVSAAHAGPVWGLHRHPQLPDVFLTVGDWGFKVWRVGVEVPILSSPMGEQQTTCGRWSTTRPGLVFVGTRDGFIQVWDLLDRSHQPVLVHAVIKDAITCIEFRPLQNPTAKRVVAQTVALGTKVGGFHFYELPRALVRGPSTELRMARQLFDRETRRVSYFSWRWEDRRKEMELRAAQINVSESEGGSGDQQKDQQQQQQQQQQQKDKKKAEDLIGGKEDEGAGDFVFTAEDDARYLAEVEELAQADSRMTQYRKSQSDAAEEK